MDTIGQILKKARQTQNVTLEEVSKKTKVHVNVLRALEEDRFEGLSPIYVKGFLKICCNYYGLSQEVLVGRYEKEFQKKKPEPVIIKPQPEFADKLPSKFDFLDLLRKLRKAAGFIIPVILIILAIVLMRIIAQKIVSFRKAHTVSSVPVEKPKQQKKVPLRTHAIAVKPTGETAVTVRREAPSVMMAGLKAREDVWIEVRLDKKLIFKGYLKKGRSENWTAKNSIEFSIGNAGVIELVYNGKLISPLGKRGQSFKQVLINKDGLSIK